MTTIERALYEWNSGKYEKHHIFAGLSKEELPAFLEQVIIKLIQDKIDVSKRYDRSIKVELPILGKVSLYTFYHNEVRIESGWQREESYATQWTLAVPHIYLPYKEERWGWNIKEVGIAAKPLAEHIANLYNLFHGKC